MANLKFKNPVTGQKESIKLSYVERIHEGDTAPTDPNCKVWIKEVESTSDDYIPNVAEVREMIAESAGGDADTLGGQEPSYYATAENISNIIDGTTQVGDSAHLGGQEAGYYATAESVTKIVDGTTKVGKAGTADSATSATQDASGNTITSYYANLSGDQTFTGNKTFKGIAYFGGGTTYYVNTSGAAKFKELEAGATQAVSLEFRGMGTSVNNGGYIDFHYNNSSSDYTTRLIEQASGVLTCTGAMKISDTTASTSTTTGALIVSGGIGCAGNIYGSKVYGAVWNDYAERRLSKSNIKAGYVVCEVGNDLVDICDKDLSSTAMLITDTYGFLIGEEETDGLHSIPVGLSGRVLAYVSEYSEPLSIGDVVCSSRDGKIRKMSKEEKIYNPECIIGVVGSIPEYKQWGSNNVEVDGRIWINLK